MSLRMLSDECIYAVPSLQIPVKPCAFKLTKAMKGNVLSGEHSERGQAATMISERSED